MSGSAHAQSAIVSGTVNLEGSANLAQVVTFDFVSQTKPVSYARSTKLTSTGTFSFADIPHDSYVLSAKGAKWLRKNVPVDSTNGNAYNVGLTLAAGDANGDNSVDPTDFNIFIGAYNSDSNIPGSGYDARADFNDDGIVDPTDFGLFVGNYNTAGDILPASPPPFRINGLLNNTSLSGQFLLNASTVIAGAAYGDGYLQIDGQEVTSVAANSVAGADGTYGIPFVIPTDEYLNGTHTISVTDGIRPDIRTVIFNNFISNVNYDPVFDPSDPSDVPGTSHITASLGSVSNWQVQITSSDGVLVRSFTGMSASVNVVWDGNDMLGLLTEDDVYTVTIQASPAPGLKPKGGPTYMATKAVSKSSVGTGAAFVLVQSEDVITNANHYIHSIRAYLKSRVPTLFTKVNIIFVTSNRIDKRPDIIAHITRQLSVPLKFLHVIAEGGDGPNPFFGIGSYTWYSSDPGDQGHGGGGINSPTRGDRSFNFDVTSLVSNIEYGGNFHDPPFLVWMDHCRSCGSSLTGGIPTDMFNNATPDFSWATTFGIEQSGIGVYLGWGGTATKYGAYKQPTSWTDWRENLYNFLFAGGNNFQTAFTRDNSITVKNFPYELNAQDRAFWTGDGTTGF